MPTRREKKEKKRMLQEQKALERRVVMFLPKVQDYIDEHFTGQQTSYTEIEDQDSNKKTSDSAKAEAPKEEKKESDSPQPDSGKIQYSVSSNVQYSFSEVEDYGLPPHLDEDDPYDLFRTLLHRNPGASVAVLNKMVKPTFVDMLLQHIESKHLKDSQVYKAAGIDRRLFSKIVSDRNYKPARDTCIALCIGLRLNLKDASDLLEKAGYTLSHSSKRDIAIEFFLVEGMYRMQEINEMLDRLGLKLFGRE